MRWAAFALALSVLAAASPAGAQLSLQRPDDGINTPAPAPDPMLDQPIVHIPPAKPAPSSSAPAKKPADVKAAPAKPPADATAPQTAAKPVSYRQCADSYFAGASLLRSNPTVVDTLLQRAQIAGERQLKANPGADQMQLIQAIKMSGTARAAEIRALDEEAGPKAAQNLFNIIRQCDAKLGLSLMPRLPSSAQSGLAQPAAEVPPLGN